MADDTPAPEIIISGAGVLMARFRTKLGDFEAELFEAQAPRTVANFVALATGSVCWTDAAGRAQTKPLYPGTCFHRVIPEFMIQGGDPGGDGRGGPGYRWRDEPSALALKHDQPGTLSMANAGPDTQGSQFFVTEVPLPSLDGMHAVFGRVTSGMDVVQRIARVPRNQNDKPLTPVKISEIVVYRG